MKAKTMEYLGHKAQLVVYYMNNIDEFSPVFWEKLKATKLKDMSEDYINDVSMLIDYWIKNGKDAFYKKYW